MSTDKVTFSSRLREERERLGLSQAAIASSCGVSREVWGRYENAKTVPGADVLISFVNLGADANYLLVGVRSGNENNWSQVEKRDVEKQLNEIIEIFSHTTNDGRQSLLSLAKLIKSID